MIGLWDYYAATVAANAPDLDARDDLSGWGARLDYELCKENGVWTRPCATESTQLVAPIELLGGCAEDPRKGNPQACETSRGEG